MTAQESWKEVGEQLEGLALKLKMHAEQAQSTGAQELRKSLSALGKAIEETFDALVRIAADPALKDDVRKVGTSLSDALFNTFSEINSEVAKAFGSSEEASA